MDRTCGAHVRRQSRIQDFGVKGTFEAERLLGRPGLRWEDAIKIDFQEVGKRLGLN
jgi:hypothetical protein